MANEQKINEIIDQKAYDQLKKLEEELGIVVKVLSDAILAAEKLNSVIASSKTVGELNKAIAQQQILANKVAISAKQVEVAEFKKQQVYAKAAIDNEKRAAKDALAAEKAIKADAERVASIEKKTKTVISNSQAEVDAYNNAIDGSARLKTAVTEEQELEAQVASSLTALSLARGTNTEEVKKKYRSN